MAEIATASGKSALISGALVRRHCGLWKIIDTQTVYDEDGEYVSDQLFDDIGGWSMLQARGKAFIRLDIDEGVYSARFSRASQFMGDCWDL